MNKRKPFYDERDGRAAPPSLKQEDGGSSMVPKWFLLIISSAQLIIVLVTATLLIYVFGEGESKVIRQDCGSSSALFAAYASFVYKSRVLLRSSEKIESDYSDRVHGRVPQLAAPYATIVLFAPNEVVKAADHVMDEIRVEDYRADDFAERVNYSIDVFVDEVRQIHKCNAFWQQDMR